MRHDERGHEIKILSYKEQTRFKCTFDKKLKKKERGRERTRQDGREGGVTSGCACYFPHGLLVKSIR